MTNGDLFAARWRELAKAFLKLGATSFGGPAIIGVIHSELQERRGWLTKERFLEGVSLVNMLPGGAVMQLCIFIGYQRAGWRGGLLAGLAFLLPPTCIMLALTLLYASYGALPIMRDALYGLGPVVLGIYIVTVIRLGTTALTNSCQVVIACVAAVTARLHADWHRWDPAVGRLWGRRVISLPEMGSACRLSRGACSAWVALWEHRTSGSARGNCLIERSGARPPEHRNFLRQCGSIHFWRRHYHRGFRARASGAPAEMAHASRIS
ncbi:MAG: hypothetical protein GEU91_24615 [Rhizobiales bacterium]|nr:hypothetical protein [Hyphomicrobiales bacterium]